MNDDADGAPMGAPVPASTFLLRAVPKATTVERLAREEGLARALRNGATPYRDRDGKWRHIPFKDANLAAVVPWVRDPKAKRGYRRVQELRKAAGQLVGQPGDRIEIAKRLGELHWEQGSDTEGAARRGLYDAIWSREHVYDSFTVPRRTGRTPIDTGRIAAVAEEEARKIQAEDPKARGGFWVRDRNDFGLLYVVPNADPVEEGTHAGTDPGPSAVIGDDVVASGEGEDAVLGQADSAMGGQSTSTEATDTQPRSAAESTTEQRDLQVLHYPDIPLARPVPAWQVPQGAQVDGDGPPIINMEKDRIKNILANEPAQFEVTDQSAASGEEPTHADHSYGYWAVWIHEDVIDYEAERQGVDPDLVKAIVYVENAQGWYGHPLEQLRLAKTIFPMNINPTTWSGLVREGADFYDPLTNIRAGVTLVRRLLDRIEEPTVAKVASPFKFTGREFVSDYGARVAEVYASRAWERTPEPPIYPESDKPVEWRPENEGYGRRREELKKRLAEGGAQERVLDDPLWGNASP